MAIPTEFIRDWVYTVVAPFLTQLKNRLGNIRIAKQGKVVIFHNGENIATNLDFQDPPTHRVNILKPQFARRRVGDSGTKGFLVIKYPFDYASTTMAMFDVDAYVYQVQQSFKICIGGYNYSTPRWANTFAKKVTPVANQYKKVQFVRFLFQDGDESREEDYAHFGFIIGKDDNTQWDYANIAISKAVLGYNNFSNAIWDTDGWSIEVMQEADIPVHRVDITRNV